MPTRATFYVKSRVMRARGMCTNSWWCFRPSSAPCFQSGCLPILSVPMPSATRSWMLQRLSVCRQGKARRLRFVLTRSSRREVKRWLWPDAAGVVRAPGCRTD
jgi:hypothetical protein